MNSSDYKVLVKIRDCCEANTAVISHFGNDDKSFADDTVQYFAAAMCILQIGELSKSLSSELREETKGQVGRKKLRGLRNWIAHDFEGMDESVVWRTSMREIPKVLHFCEKTLKAERVVTDSLPSLSQILERSKSESAEKNSQKKKTDVSHER